MNEKLIYWIDDDENDMYAVAKGVIQKLWNLEGDDGVRSKILLVGSASDFDDIEKSYSEDDEKMFRWKIEDIFIRICRNIQRQDPLDDLYEKKKHLIEDPITVVFKDVNNDAQNGSYSKLNELWSQQALEEEGDENYNNAKLEINKLISIMQIPQHALVGIDVLLLSDDEYRIMENKRIVSMELYHQLTELDYRCFLYSSEADNKALVNNWNEVYRKFYKDENKDIMIWLRQELTQKGSEKTVEKLKALVEQNMGEKHD